MAEIDAYDYHLPPELIAQQPLARRSDARLLVVRRSTGSLEHRHVRDLPELLAPGDCLALNDTKVIPARLVGYRERTQGKWQGLFLGADASGADPAGVWQIICKTRGTLESGERIVIVDPQGREAATLTMLARLDKGRWAVRPDGEGSWHEQLERMGRVPLPPYIRGGEMQPGDQQSYQTVYASTPGAVAAPTAGLHFTTDLLEQLAVAGVDRTSITLHVGIGTFRPVETARLEDHPMHSEWAQVTASAAEKLIACRQRKGRIVAIGTTVVRTLESAFAAIGSLQAWEGETDLFIRPPYQFRAIDALLTNFHLPKSTLLVLVRTLGGDELMKRAYDEAIRERYRFFSYGDAMLIL
ncbi:MAG: tRNA preQ1(34) S-adenosylmethionine ribosyltransferase-isomerase QueA [Pirellulales bacterium]